jgi:hypothetical protein
MIGIMNVNAMVHHYQNILVFVTIQHCLDITYVNAIIYIEIEIHINRFQKN